MRDRYLTEIPSTCDALQTCLVGLDLPYHCERTKGFLDESETPLRSIYVGLDGATGYTSADRRKQMRDVITTDLFRER